MFDTKHILFMIFSFIGLAITFVLCKLFVKNQNKKDFILKFAAIITVAIHYSPMYVDFFKTGSATLYETMLFPLYPCNVAMWLLLIVAFIKNKNSKVFKVLAEITFYLGLVGGILGIALNEIYANNPTFAEWDVLHGLISHVTLLLGSVWLLVGGYIKIRVNNVFSVLIGFTILLVDGWVLIGLYRLCNFTPVNCMFLLEPPLAGAPFLNTYVIGIGVTLIIFIITCLVEQFALKKEERWYSKIKEKIQNRRKI